MIDHAEVLKSLDALARQYPQELVKTQLDDVGRIAFNIGLVVARAGTGSTICDIGGGVGLFAPGCSSLGLKAIVVDDFRDDVNLSLGKSALAVHNCLGVTIIDRDVIKDGLGLAANSLDVVTSFDSMEHWHHSPKQLFQEVMRTLKPGGFFILSVPNCVNLRKRITVPLGFGKWSSMEEWYEKPVFRGHVREPDLADLKYIAADMGLTETVYLGKNWLGHGNSRPIVRISTAFFDPILQHFPYLCSDLYLIGKKPGK